MFYHQQENKYVNEGTEFTIGDITYPPQWLQQTTLEEKQAIGLEEVTVVGERKDTRYYWNNESLEGAVLTLTSTPRDLDSVKKEMLAAVDNTAYLTLLPTDYMAGKAFETGTTVPTEWAEWRESIRAAARTAIADITAATDVDTIAALTITWPNNPDYVTPAIEEEPSV